MNPREIGQHLPDSRRAATGLEQVVLVGDDPRHVDRAQLLVDQLAEVALERPRVLGARRRGQRRSVGAEPRAHELIERDRLPLELDRERRAELAPAADVGVEEVGVPLRLNIRECWRPASRYLTRYFLPSLWTLIAPLLASWSGAPRR